MKPTPIIVYAIPKNHNKRFKEEVVGVLLIRDKATIEEIKHAAEARGYHSFRVEAVKIKGV